MAEELKVNLCLQKNKCSYGDNKSYITFFRNYFSYNTPLESYIIKYNSITFIKKYHNFNIHIHTPEVIITVSCTEPFDENCVKLFINFYTHLLAVFSHNESEPIKEG